MPHFLGEKTVILASTHNGFEPRQGTSQAKALDPALKTKLAELACFLDEIEDCSHALREDQLEQVIANAVATCGFGSSTEARATLEWMFQQSLELS
jgi:hypothetical protein